jgi:hypothetical protein
VRAAALRRALAAELVAVPLVAGLPALRERSERGNHFAEWLGRDILAGLPPRTVLFGRGTCSTTRSSTSRASSACAPTSPCSTSSL